MGGVKRLLPYELPDAAECGAGPDTNRYKRYKQSLLKLLWNIDTEYWYIYFERGGYECMKKKHCFICKTS